eukprot:TRINITY_DN5348_c0_g1_i1.p1 TRINITY_DN5348_c0_g1~~TRINITY_DN5348_c0_g1_i1.p1  ORF type:complete len:291 (+),score=40.27 TRINITY_DN5348_c0_g1_i1:214-1086(+)
MSNKSKQPKSADSPPTMPNPAPDRILIPISMLLNAEEPAQPSTRVPGAPHATLPPPQPPADPKHTFDSHEASALLSALAYSRAPDESFGSAIMPDRPRRPAAAHSVALAAAALARRPSRRSLEGDDLDDDDDDASPRHPSTRHRAAKRPRKSSSPEHQYPRASKFVPVEGHPRLFHLPAVQRFADHLYGEGEGGRHSRLLLIEGYLYRAVYGVSHVKFAITYLGGQTRKTSIEHIGTRIRERRSLSVAFDELVAEIMQWLLTPEAKNCVNLVSPAQRSAEPSSPSDDPST